MLKIWRVVAVAIAMLAFGATSAFATCDGLAPTISGTSAAETINGTSGADVIEGGGGADTINGLGDNDVICGNGGDDIINGGSGADRLFGDTGYDTFRPGSGNDHIDGGSNAGVLDFQTVGATTTINLSGGTASGDGSDTVTAIHDAFGSNTHSDNIDGTTSANVLDGNGGDDDIDGKSGSDDLDGGEGDDTLRPGTGDDTVAGGADVDLISYSEIGASVVVSLDVGSPQATSGAGTDTLSDLENLIGTDYADTLSGSTGVNDIRGGAGADTIDGLDGVDDLRGETGDDSLTGGAGDDSLDGGANIDVIDYHLASGGVTIDLSTGVATGDGSDLIANMENIIASDNDDVIDGDDEVNDIQARAGNDVVDTHAGMTDDVHGGDGDDTLSYASSTVGVYDTLGVSVPSAPSSAADDHADFEHLSGTNFNDRLGARAGGSTLAGGSGDDDLYGGDGGDTLTGSEGRDEFFPGDGSDTVSGGGDDDLVDYDDSGSGVTIVLGDVSPGSASGSSIGSDTLDGIEDVVGSGYADDITGNDSSNDLRAGSSDDTVVGASGNDQLRGQSGDDILNGGIGTDLIDGGDTGTNVDTATYSDAPYGVAVDLNITGVQATNGSGNDTVVNIENLIGSSSGDTLIGDDGDNTITGGAGADKLYAGRGEDILHGGDGPDMLRLDDGIADSATASTCGSGFDTAHADDIDTISGCEIEKDTPDTTPPTGTVAFAEVSGQANQHSRGSTNFLNSTGAGSFTISIAARDLASGTHSVAFPDLGSGWSPAGGIDYSAPYTMTYTFSAAPSAGTFEATMYDIAGNSATVAFHVASDNTPPAGGSITYIDGTPTTAEVVVAFASALDAGSGVSAHRLQRRVGALVGSGCDAYGAWSDIGSANQASPFADTGLAPDRCYQYRLEATDHVGNATVVATSERSARINDCLFA